MRSLAPLLIAIAACAPLAQTSQDAQAGVRLMAETVDSRTVRLTLHNDSSDPAGYNLCTSRLQRRDGSTWMRVETDEVCTMELRTLQPGSTATFEKRLPAGIAPGEYRYVTNVEMPLGSAQGPVATEPFPVD